MSSENTPAYSRVQSIAECSICVEIMRDPKTLKCQHSYCKECLEGIVQVDKINGAVVKCPMCQNEHVLEDGKTVSDLEPQLTLKQVLDLIDEYHSRSRIYAQRSIDVEKKLSPRCLHGDDNSTEHNEAMEWYCLDCKSFFCQQCLNLHSLLSMCGNNKFYQVKYCEKYDSFTIYCGVHQAFHSYGCELCCETFCNYCLAENHTKESCLIGESDTVYKGKVIPLMEYATKFKDPLLRKIAVMKEYITKQETVLDEIDNSSLTSQSKIDDFKKYVEERKMAVLSHILFFLESTGKQMVNDFKSELAEYETSKQKMKVEIGAKLNSVQDVLEKSETLAGSSMIEVIARTADLQDEFHTILPGDIEDHQINIPPYCNVGDKLTVDDDLRQLLVAGVQASFNGVHISTMKDDGSFEAIEKLLNFSDGIDYNPKWITKLDDVRESRKYAVKSLKKMGLQENVGNTQAEKEVDGEVVVEEKGKGKKKNKNKNKDANSNLPAEKEAGDGEVVEEEKGKGKKKNKNKNKNANSTVLDEKESGAAGVVEEEILYHTIPHQEKGKGKNKKKNKNKDANSNLPEKEVGDGEVVEEEKGKGKKKNKNKNKDVDSTTLEEIESGAPEVLKVLLEEEKGKGKEKKKNKIKDANTVKSSLNKLAQNNHWSNATYHTVQVNGGFISTVTLNGLQYNSLSVCKVKKDAERNAAQVALMYLTGAPLPTGDSNAVDITGAAAVGDGSSFTQERCHSASSSSSNFSNTLDDSSYLDHQNS